jgi:Spy/CpxP family protein refolding chaperone
MRNHRKNAIYRSLVLAASAAALISIGSLSLADQKPGAGDQMKQHREMHNGMKGIRPHNAAEHFLTMKTTLKLSDDQVKQLTKLRDDYIKDNATTEEQVSAGYSDLPNLLYADNVDVSSTNDKIDNLLKMETQLWHAYTQQLHDIQTILTPEQKKILSESWEKAHADMGAHGDMPMHHDKKAWH